MKREEAAWAIVRDMGAVGLGYFDGAKFVVDNLAAIRFARRIDAERTLTLLHGTFVDHGDRVEEHMWPEPGPLCATCGHSHDIVSFREDGRYTCGYCDCPTLATNPPPTQAAACKPSEPGASLDASGGGREESVSAEFQSSIEDGERRLAAGLGINVTERVPNAKEIDEILDWVKDGAVLPLREPLPTWHAMVQAVPRAVGSAQDRVQAVVAAAVDDGAFEALVLELERAQDLLTGSGGDPENIQRHHARLMKARSALLSAHHDAVAMERERCAKVVIDFPLDNNEDQAERDNTIASAIRAER